MSQEFSATSRRSIWREDITGGEYNERVDATARELLKKKMVRINEDYGGDGDNESPPRDYSDYDFYRKHGDIPSPGVGH